MKRYGFIEPIQEFASQEKPIFGTCAGMVLFAKDIGEEESHLNLMDILPFSVMDLVVKWIVSR